MAKFFVVRKINGINGYAVEHGDFSSRYKKEDKDKIVFREQFNSQLSLPDLVDLYLADKFADAKHCSDCLQTDRHTKTCLFYEGEE